MDILKIRISVSALIYTITYLLICCMIIDHHQLSDQQYMFTAIKACASRRDWKAIEELLTVKVCMYTFIHCRNLTE